MPSTRYPPPYGPAMQETINLPILPGRSDKIVSKPSTPAFSRSFTDTFIVAIPREKFDRLMSEPVDSDLLPTYPHGFEYLTGPLDYKKFCADSDKLAIENNIPVLSRLKKDAGWVQGLVYATNNGRDNFIMKYRKDTDKSTECAINTMQFRFNRGLGKMREENTPGIDNYFDDLKARYPFLDIKTLDLSGSGGKVIAVSNTRDVSNAASSSDPTNYTDIANTRDCVPHVKAGICAPPDIALKETPGKVVSFTRDFVRVAAKPGAPAVSTTAKTNLRKIRKVTNPRSRDSAARNRHLHKGGFSSAIHAELGQSSESEDDDLSALSEDELDSDYFNNYKASSNVKVAQASESEFHSKVETRAKPSTFSTPLTHDNKPLSLEQQVFGREDDSGSEVDNNACAQSTASHSNTFASVGSARGDKHENLSKPESTFTVPAASLKADDLPDPNYQHHGRPLDRDPNAPHPSPNARSTRQDVPWHVEKAQKRAAADADLERELAAWAKARAAARFTHVDSPNNSPLKIAADVEEAKAKAKLRIEMARHKATYRRFS